MAGLAVALVMAGCGSGEMELDRGAPTREPDPPDAADEVELDDEERGPLAPTDGIPEDEADPQPVGEARMGPWRSADHPRRDGGTARLGAARLIAHEAFDRLVLELEGPAPSWTVTRESGPVVESSTGEVAGVDGEAYLRVELLPATSLDFDSSEPTAAYRGPERLVGETIVEALLVADGDRTLEWVVGLDGEHAVAVTLLADPQRLVIDVVPDA